MHGENSSQDFSTPLYKYEGPKPFPTSVLWNIGDDSSFFYFVDEKG
jgi:hypothetical protein